MRGPRPDALSVTVWTELPTELAVIEVWEREYDRPLDPKRIPILMSRIRDFLAGKKQIVGSVAPVAGKCAARCRLSVIYFGEWRYCKGPRLKGRQRCRMHGDKKRTGGPKSMFAKNIPQRLAESFHEGRTAEELLSLRNDIKLIDAMEQEALRHMKLGDIEKLVRDGAPAAKDVEQGIKDANLPLIRSGAERLAKLFDGDTIACAAATTRVRQLVQEKKKLVETERRLEEWRYQALTAEQVMTIVRLLIDVIEDEVEEVAVVTRIRERFLAITTRPALKVVS